MKIIWKDRALQSLDKIELFLFEKIGLEDTFIFELLDKIGNSPQKLLQFPRMGQLTDIIAGEEVRRMLVKGYKVYYKVDVDTIVILNVLHSKEDIEGILND